MGLEDPNERQREWVRLLSEPVPNIYGALEGIASALTSTVKLLERAVNDWERREEELRDAHLDLANALNRRMDELHTHVDESITTLASRVDVMRLGGRS